MDPDANKFVGLTGSDAEEGLQDQLGEVCKAAGALTSPLLRPDGSPVPDHWSVFTTGELVTVKNYTFKVAYIGESTLLLEPHGPVLVGEGKE